MALTVISTFDPTETTLVFAFEETIGVETDFTPDSAPINIGSTDKEGFLRSQAQCNCVRVCMRAWGGGRGSDGGSGMGADLGQRQGRERFYTRAIVVMAGLRFKVVNTT